MPPDFKKKDIFTSLAGLALIVLVILYASTKINMAGLDKFVAQIGIWGPIILILAKASTLVFAPITGSPVYLAAGAVFGFWPGILYIFIGDFIGGTISFFISRIFGRNVVKYFVAKSHISSIDHMLRYMSSWWGLFKIRIFFTAMPETVSYAAGLTDAPYWRYLVINSVVSIIPTMIFVKFGSILLSGQSQIVVFWSIILGSLGMLFGFWLFYMDHKRQQAKEAGRVNRENSVEKNSASENL